MKGLNAFERSVFEMMLAGDHPYLADLRAQARRGVVSSREYTGVGFFCDFSFPDDVDHVAPANATFGDVGATMDGVKHGAGFLIFFREGQMRMLEGYTYADPWPEVIENPKLDYVKAEYGKDAKIVEVPTASGPRYLDFHFPRPRG